MEFGIASRRMAVTLVSFALEKSNKYQWIEERCGYVHVEFGHTHFSGRGIRAIGSHLFWATHWFFQQVSGQKPTFRKMLAISEPIKQSIQNRCRWKEGLSDYLQYFLGPAHLSGWAMRAPGSQANWIPTQTVIRWKMKFLWGFFIFFPDNKS